MNKLQNAIIWLAVMEIILICLSMPLFMFRMQEAELTKTLEAQKLTNVSLSTNISTTAREETRALTLDEKIDLANSYNSTITSIPIEKGESYTANQICSIAAGELDKITAYYSDISPVMKQLRDMQISQYVRECGIFLEQQSHEDVEGGIGYADVETVDEVDVDMNSVYLNGDHEVSINAMMYVNSSEPDQVFIVWQLSYYNLKDDTTIFVLFDDETGKFLSVAGSISSFNNEKNYSLYSQISETSNQIKEYYRKEDAGELAQSIQE